MSVAVKNNEYNTRFKDIGGTLKLLTTDGDQTLVTVSKSTRSIFIQKLRVLITVDAAQSISFEDSNGTPRKIAEVVASPGKGFQTWDYGPQGVQLNEGKNFVCNVSAAGLEATIEWEGYERPTAAAITAGTRATGLGV